MKHNYKNLRLWGYEFLKNFSSSPMLDSELLLSISEDCNRSDIIAHSDKVVSDIDYQRYKNLLSLRRNGFPIHYLIGKKEFFSIDFFVSSNTLIPRPETELLVDTALSLFGKNEKINILELGTGCGAIALTLKKNRPMFSVTATDKSIKALDMAKINADKLGLEVNFVVSDWFKKVKYNNYDLIISNPPYVEERALEFNNNLKYEPRLALYGGKTGLNSLNLIISEAIFHLNSGGYLVLEHGAEQAKKVIEFALENKYISCQSLKDMNNKDRCLIAQRSI